MAKYQEFNKYYVFRSRNKNLDEDEIFEKIADYQMKISILKYILKDERRD